MPVSQDRWRKEKRGRKGEENGRVGLWAKWQNHPPVCPRAAWPWHLDILVIVKQAGSRGSWTYVPIPRFSVQQMITFRSLESNLPFLSHDRFIGRMEVMILPNSLWYESKMKKCSPSMLHGALAIAVFHTLTQSWEPFQLPGSDPGTSLFLRMSQPPAKEPQRPLSPTQKKKTGRSSLWLSLAKAQQWGREKGDSHIWIWFSH